MTTRMRALLAICAITITSFALATTANAAPADFGWSTSLSTAQAGGHPNITMSYSSSSTQSLTRLDVDLPQGLMHRNNLSSACSNALYLADSCPASSTLGTVATQIVVARVTISVPGTIYQLAPAAGSDATFGIVLRPPLSSLGLTSKLFVRDQVSFTNGGGLRHSLIGPLNSVTALGVSLPSRIAQLTLTYNGQAGGVALTNNPTSCRAQSFTATGTFSDGTTRPRTSSYTTTGCPAVPFAPTAEVQLQTNAPNQKTNFAILLGGGGSGGSNLHAGHAVAIGHDFDAVGDFDLETLDAGPLCTDAQAATTPLSCPAGSKLFDISADIEGFGTVTGQTFKTNSPGHKTVGEITLRQGVTARFSGEIGGANKSTLTFNGLPQLPFTSIRIRSVKAAMWITNTCAIRTTRMTIDSHSGARVQRTSSTPAPECPPAAPTITAGPERGITINTSHVEYRFSSPESGVTFECKKDDADYVACASPFVDDWQGEAAHTFAVRGVSGTGVRGSPSIAIFNIDTKPPVVTFTDPYDFDADGDKFADLPFRTQDPTFELDVSDETSGVDLDKLEVWFDDEDPATPSTRGHVRAHVQGHVQVGGPAVAPPGPTTVTVKVYDHIGWVTIVKLGFIVDGSPPAISIDEPGVHYATGPDVNIPITVEDDSLKYEKGEVALECARKGWDGTIKGSAKVITDRDSGRSKGFCSFDNVSEGSYKVTVRGWDPVKKESFAETDLVVDRTAPTIELLNPADADLDRDGIADKRFRPAFFDISVELSDKGSGIDKEDTSCVAKVVNKGVVKGNITFNNANRALCSFDNMPEGDAAVEIRTSDYVGTVTIVKRGFTVDTQPPSAYFVDTGDLDSDGDGFADNRTRPKNFQIPIGAADSGSAIDPDASSCLLKPRAGGVVTGVVTVIGSTMSCSFRGAPQGDADVEITVADSAGHVTVLKTAVTVELPPPLVTLNLPAPGTEVAQGSVITTDFTVVGMSVYEYRCLIDNVVMSNDCPSGSSFNIGGLSLGTHTFTVIARDEFGNDTSVSREFTVVSADGGGGGVIILP